MWLPGCVYVCVCQREGRWALVRCCGSLNTDEGQTEGWLASSLLSILPCRSLSPLCVSGSRTSGCSSNINTNSVIMGSHITSLPWYDVFLQPICLSAPSPPSPTPPHLSQWSKWTEEGRSPLQKMNLKVRMLCFYVTVYNFVVKRCRLNIFTPDFKQHLCFTGTQGAASSPVGCPGLVA